VCLVVPDGGPEPFIERILRATRKDEPRTKRILEINPDHRLVKNLDAIFKRDPASPDLGQWIELLFDEALLAEGSPIEDPSRFAARRRRCSKRRLRHRQLASIDDSAVRTARVPF
jgi:molecular chaperone HtpG